MRAALALLPTAANAFAFGISCWVEGTWEAPYAAQILDLEVTQYWVVDTLAFSGGTDGLIHLADIDGGGSLGSLPAPAGVIPTGLAWFQGDFYVCRQGDPLIYKSDGSGGWLTFLNPAGTSGGTLECFDIFGDQLWESEYDGGQARLFVFDSDGTGAVTIDLQGLPGQVTGLAVYPLCVDQASDPFGGIIACCGDSPYFYTYYVSGTTAYPEPSGPTPFPFPVAQTTGLACSGTPDGQFFWSYLGTDGVYHVSEIWFDVNELAPETWGGIKAGTGE
ncbi:MAG: hypothetical protein QUS11_07275 [Candidatus Fermentibacter sp.]|nr:hypothetical protein [Candidatus Fermentibacter sp.]